jgi:hypothetical protein
METLEDADDEKVELAEDTKLIVKKVTSLEPFRQQLQTLIKSNYDKLDNDNTFIRRRHTRLQWSFLCE